MGSRPAIASLDAREDDVLFGQVGAYYAGKLHTHGPTALGVDWSCRPTQELRFVQLLKVCDFTQPFSLNDLGCGYGALREFLKQRWPRADIDYLGVDLVPDMVEQASRKWHGVPSTDFAVGQDCTRIADYSVASGIFNVKLDLPVNVWDRFARATLADMHASSRRGFAVNFLRLAPDIDNIPQLYRAPAEYWRSYCEDELGVRTEVLARYGMNEFTLLARK